MVDRLTPANMYEHIAKDPRLGSLFAAGALGNEAPPQDGFGGQNQYFGDAAAVQNRDSGVAALLRALLGNETAPNERVQQGWGDAHQMLPNPFSGRR